MAWSKTAKQFSKVPVHLSRGWLLGSPSRKLKPQRDGKDSVVTMLKDSHLRIQSSGSSPTTAIKQS